MLSFICVPWPLRAVPAPTEQSSGQGYSCVGPPVPGAQPGRNLPTITSGWLSGLSREGSSAFWDPRGGASQPATPILNPATWGAVGSQNTSGLPVCTAAPTIYSC